jgi:hypothetical protein
MSYVALPLCCWLRGVLSAIDKLRLRCKARSPEVVQQLINMYWGPVRMQIIHISEKRIPLISCTEHWYSFPGRIVETAKWSTIRPLGQRQITILVLHHTAKRCCWLVCHPVFLKVFQAPDLRWRASWRLSTIPFILHRLVEYDTIGG